MGDRNVPINMVLLGNEGHGKSSFGNCILNKKAFPVSADGLAPIRTLGYDTGNRGKFAMKVVEIPVCPDEQSNNQQARRNMMIKRARELCDNNLHLFLLVIKFDGEKPGNGLQVFDKWREILASKIFARRGVIVITFSDEFTTLMDTFKTPDKKFINWCCEQGGSLYNLFKECNQRLILFNNNTHTDHIFEELSSYMDQLSYTDNNFNTKPQNDSNFWNYCAVFLGGVVVGGSAVFSGLKNAA